MEKVAVWPMLSLCVTIFLTGCVNEPAAQPLATPTPVLETFSFPSPETSADISAAGVPRFKGSAKGKEKTLYLTFDDGPDLAGTPAVLKTLKKLNVKATFFVNGTHIQGTSSKNILKKMVKEGHTVNVHGWGHPDMTKLTTEQVRSELNKTKSIIQKVTGGTPTCFRPPYGAYNSVVKKVSRETKLRIQLWSIDPLDWKSPGPTKLAASIVSKLHPNAVILLHDGAGHGNQAAGALPVLVKKAQSEGYSFQTLCSQVR